MDSTTVSGTYRNGNHSNCPRYTAIYIGRSILTLNPHPPFFRSVYRYSRVGARSERSAFKSHQTAVSTYISSRASGTCEVGNHRWRSRCTSPSRNRAASGYM